MRSFLHKIYTSTFLSKEKANHFQMIARNEEWNAIKDHIPKGSKFLDVGCGAGYSMKRAKEDRNCEIHGIDPNPTEHGVGRIGSNYLIENIDIKQAFAESIPFSDKIFNTVYSSHVLEHVNSESKALKEMKRVLKDDGILIIGVPTSTMTIINWISQILFLTHIKIISILFSKVINTEKYRWWELFVPRSHSFENKSILYDLNHYRINNWSNIISKEFKIEQTILPALYPYPEFIQLFKIRKFKKFSSSVFFICTKIK